MYTLIIIIITATGCDCRSETAQMWRVPEGVQTQTPSDRAQAASQRRKTVPVFQVHETFLALGLVQPTHEPPVLVLQTVQRVRKNNSCARREPSIPIPPPSHHNITPQQDTPQPQPPRATTCDFRWFFFPRVITHYIWCNLYHAKNEKHAMDSFDMMSTLHIYSFIIIIIIITQIPTKILLCYNI